jgi:hypothetical protein
MLNTSLIMFLYFNSIMVFIEFILFLYWYWLISLIYFRLVKFGLLLYLNLDFRLVYFLMYGCCHRRLSLFMLLYSHFYLYFRFVIIPFVVIITVAVITVVAIIFIIFTIVYVIMIPQFNISPIPYFAIHHFNQHKQSSLYLSYSFYAHLYLKQ